MSGEFGEYAAVESVGFLVVEDVREEGTGEAAVAAEKSGAEGREIFHTVAFIPSAFHGVRVFAEFAVEVFPHYQCESLVVLVGGSVREAVVSFESCDPFLFQYAVGCHKLPVSVLRMV